MISFIVPGQPQSTNKLYEPAERFDRYGNRYRGRRKADRAIEYQGIAQTATQKAKPNGWDPGPWDPKTGEGLIVIRYWWMLDHMVDCDNAKKTLNDGIALGLGTKVVRSRNGTPKLAPIYDDARFLGQDMGKQTGVKKPYVRIEILAPGEW